jgi:hypothetical protein
MGQATGFGRHLFVALFEELCALKERIVTLEKQRIGFFNRTIYAAPSSMKVR